MSIFDDILDAAPGAALDSIPGIGPALGSISDADRASERHNKAERIKRWKRTNSGTLTVEECAQLWVDAGGKKSDAAMAAVITRPESGGRVDVVNEIGATGLWQIHPGGSQYKNAWNNARTAVRKRRAAGKWGPNPWAVCHDASCSNLSQEAQELAKRLHLDSGLIDLGGAVDSVNPVDDVADAIMTVVRPIGDFFKIITSADTWIRIGKVLLGALFLALVANELIGRKVIRIG